MTYEEARNSVARERETEQWLRSQDWSEIVMRIHELEDEINGLDAKLAKALEALEKVASYDPEGCNLDQSWASDALAEIEEQDI
jgi:hypothetical protein